MSNRNNRVYVDGTAALDIQDCRNASQANVVCLSRSRDGRLFVEEPCQRARHAVAVSRLAAQPDAAPSFRDDLRVAAAALGIQDMRRTFKNGTARGKAFPQANRFAGALFGAAFFFAMLAASFC